jgi:hypothetical protein
MPNQLLPLLVRGFSEQHLVVANGPLPAPKNGKADVPACTTKLTLRIGQQVFTYLVAS